MMLTAEDLIVDKVYVLKRDYIETPQIRHNFGTEVIFRGYVSPNGQNVMVKIKGAVVENNFMIPIDILKEKEGV
jgi:hypothetical protein